MIANRLELARGIVLAGVAAAILSIAGCTSHQASASAADSTVPYPTATNLASPTAGARLNVTPDSAATLVSGQATPDSAVVGNGGSATALAATPAEASSTPLPVTTPSPVAMPKATATLGAATTETVAVPLFLTVTAPAEELLEVPAGTAGVTISGKTVPSAVLSVNGNLVSPDSSGNFQVTVPVNGDVTLVEVVASDVTGAEFHVQRVIVRD